MVAAMVEADELSSAGALEKRQLRILDRIADLEVRLSGGHKLVSNGDLADGATRDGCAENGHLQCVKKGSSHGEVRIWSLVENLSLC